MKVGQIMEHYTRNIFLGKTYVYNVLEKLVPDRMFLSCHVTYASQSEYTDQFG